MEYVYTLCTDIGISRKVNQDSLLVKSANYSGTNVLLAIVCDGMGGLSRGELVSGTVIQEFSTWFDRELPTYLDPFNVSKIAEIWKDMLCTLNARIYDYNKARNNSMGTTFTGILYVGNIYLIAHVGDSRLYKISPNFEQLSTDHTLVYREYRKGNMTLEEAETHPKKNVLLQCIGASKEVFPELITGKVDPHSVYLICSDGFRHKLTTQEIMSELSFDVLKDEDSMYRRIRRLIDVVKSRKETDNISAVLIKAQ